MKAQHILIPTDFSEESLSILKLADLFVDEFGSTIDLMHVVPVTRYFAESFSHLGYPYDLEKELYPKALNVAHQKLEELAEEHIKKEHRGKMIAVIDRKPYMAIAHQANGGSYDLLLMSSKGEHDSEFLRGSITEKVIRHSHIPVLSMETPFKAADINTIMVPVDMSELSLISIPHAIELASRFGAGLLLYHSVELYAADVEMIPLYPPFENDNLLYDHLLKKIGKYLKQHSEFGLSVHEDKSKSEAHISGERNDKPFKVMVDTVISKGFSAHRDIVDYANKHADLIVMSTHGRTGFSRLLLGSTTEQVAQHAKVPLLTVRPEMVGEESNPEGSSKKINSTSGTPVL